MRSGSPDRNLSDIERLASLGELIAGIAHELNNPLTAILGYAEILQSSDIDAQIKKYINNIHIAALRSAKIVEGLLTFLRKKQDVFGTVNINEVIRQTASLFEYQMRTGGIALTLNLSSAVPSLHGDFYRLQQVFFNMLINSMQALESWPNEKRVSITSEYSGGAIRVTVADTGPGIGPDIAQKIFNPFFTTKTKGTGLGLSIVFGIVKEHGGTIRLSNQGQGCRLVLEFPCPEGIASETNNAEAVSLKMEKKKVFVVDDDELVIDAFTSVLELIGCDVTFTTSPTEALQQLRKRKDFDKIFVDYKMPFMSGLAMIEEASHFVEPGKFVVMTGDITLEPLTLKSGHTIPIIKKPVSLQELRDLFSQDA